MSLTNRPKRDGACGVWKALAAWRVQDKGAEHD